MVCIFVDHDFYKAVVYITRINAHSIAFGSRGIEVFACAYIVTSLNCFCFGKTYATDFRIGEGNFWQHVVAGPTEICFIFGKVKIMCNDIRFVVCAMTECRFAVHIA